MGGWQTKFNIQPWCRSGPDWDLTWTILSSEIFVPILVVVVALVAGACSAAGAWSAAVAAFL